MSGKESCVKTNAGPVHTNRQDRGGSWVVGQGTLGVLCHATTRKRCTEIGQGKPAHPAWPPCYRTVAGRT